MTVNDVAVQNHRLKHKPGEGGGSKGETPSEERDKPDSDRTLTDSAPAVITTHVHRDHAGSVF